MRKRVVLIATALSLVALLALAGAALAQGNKIQSTGSGTVTLDREGGAPDQATGTARFTLDEKAAGYNSLKVKLTTDQLLPEAGKVYQVWLRDTDTDHNDSVATFQTDNDGNRTLTATETIPHFAQYDEIVVTTEDQNDEDPTLNGEVVLRGDISN